MTEQEQQVQQIVNRAVEIHDREFPGSTECPTTWIGGYMDRAQAELVDEGMTLVL